MLQGSRNRAHSSPRKEESTILSGKENFTTMNTVYLPCKQKCNDIGIIYTLLSFCLFLKMHAPTPLHAEIKQFYRTDKSTFTVHIHIHLENFTAISCYYQVN